MSPTVSPLAFSRYRGRVTPAAAKRLYREALAKFERVGMGHAHRELRIVARRCTDPEHCEARDLAYYERGRVVLLKRALALPDANVLGLILHELGHAFDPTPDAPQAERRADAIAEWATGWRIRYDARGVQTVGRGSARPRWLHQ